MARSINISGHCICQCDCDSTVTHSGVPGAQTGMFAIDFKMCDPFSQGESDPHYVQQGRGSVGMNALEGFSVLSLLTMNSHVETDIVRMYLFIVSDY